MSLVLADARRATPGSCCICGAPAEQWHRSGRRDTDADGLVLAVRCCAAHEIDALRALRTLTIAELADGIPAARRATRAGSAIRRAERLLGRGRLHGRASAALAGASSSTHTHAILGAAAEGEALALMRLAAALAPSASGAQS